MQIAGMHEIPKKAQTCCCDDLYLFIPFYYSAIREVNRLEFINWNDTAITYICFDRLHYQQLCVIEFKTHNKYKSNRRRSHGGIPVVLSEWTIYYLHHLFVFLWWKVENGKKLPTSRTFDIFKWKWKWIWNYKHRE